MTYGIAFIIFGRVDTGTRGTIGAHSLISVLTKMKRLLVFIIVDTLDNLWAYQRAFGDNALEGDHVVEMC